MKTLLDKAKKVKAGDVKQTFKDISKEQFELCMALAKGEITLVAAQKALKYQNVNTVYVLSHHCFKYAVVNGLIGLNKLNKLK